MGRNAFALAPKRKALYDPENHGASRPIITMAEVGFKLARWRLRLSQIFSASSATLEWKIKPPTYCHASKTKFGTRIIWTTKSQLSSFAKNFSHVRLWRKHMISKPGRSPKSSLCLLIANVRKLEGKTGKEAAEILTLALFMTVQSIDSRCRATFASIKNQTTVFALTATEGEYWFPPFNDASIRVVPTAPLFSFVYLFCSFPLVGQLDEHYVYNSPRKLLCSRYIRNDVFASVRSCSSCMYYCAHGNDYAASDIFLGTIAICRHRHTATATDDQTKIFLVIMNDHYTKLTRESMTTSKTPPKSFASF